MTTLKVLQKENRELRAMIRELEEAVEDLIKQAGNLENDRDEALRLLGAAEEISDTTVLKLALSYVDHDVSAAIIAGQEKKIEILSKSSGFAK
jgi:type II secretory pathway predicted ATPase ExeA